MDRFVNWWKTENRYVLAVKLVAMGLLPLLSCLIYCALQGKSIGQVYLPASEWNDELFYFKQVESIVNYGYPQGYFGFNESHALKLSFAAWSPVLVFPWVLWGLVFGWNLMSPIICNIVLLTVAMLVFVWLVRPTWKQLGILTLLFFLYTPFVRYMLSGMPEVICFSMLIIFYSVAVSYLKNKTTGKLVWLFVWSGLMTLMRPYLLLFLLLPMVFWVIRSKWKGLIGSLGVLGVVLVIYALIKHYLGAEYFAPLFFTDWITAFFEEGLFGGFRYFLSKLYWNGTAFLQHMRGGIQTGLASGAFFWGYLAVLAVLVYQSVADYRIFRRQRRQSQSAQAEVAVESTIGQGSQVPELFVIQLHLAISFIGMFFALLLMYKLTEGSKHLLTFMAVGVFVISLMKTKFYKKPVFIGAVFAYFYIYMALDPYDYQVPFAEETRVAQVEEWEAFYDGYLELESVDVPNYQNAVIWTFSDEVDGKTENLKWQFLYGLPEGFGISCCMPEYIRENFEQLQCRYIATVSGGSIDLRCQDAGWQEVHRDDEVVMYVVFRP